MSPERRFTVEVSGLSPEVDDGTVRAALAMAVRRLHDRGGLAVGTSGGTIPEGQDDDLAGDR